MAPILPTLWPSPAMLWQFLAARTQSAPSLVYRGSTFPGPGNPDAAGPEAHAMSLWLEMMLS